VPVIARISHRVGRQEVVVRPHLLGTLAVQPATAQHISGIGKIAPDARRIVTHFHGVDTIHVEHAFRVVIEVNAVFGPAHAADKGVVEHIGLFVLGVAFVAYPLARRRQQFVDA
jgi:hypothetical protein